MRATEGLVEGSWEESPLTQTPPLWRGPQIFLEKRIWEATNTDESFRFGGFNFLGAFKLDPIEPLKCK
jgi:hypothetical protein